MGSAQTTSAEAFFNRPPTRRMPSSSRTGFSESIELFLGKFCDERQHDISSTCISC